MLADHPAANRRDGRPHATRQSRERRSDEIAEQRLSQRTGEPHHHGKPPTIVSVSPRRRRQQGEDRREEAAAVRISDGVRHRATEFSGA